LDEHNFSEEIFDLPIKLEDVELEMYLGLYRKLITIREIENLLASQRKAGLIGGPVHLAAGQEAIAVGISTWLKKTDHIFSAHRSHAHLLALNSDPYRLFAEVLGRTTGLSRGFGGSMHLWDGKSGFRGSVPIVAGTIPLAVGAGLSAKLLKGKSIGVSYFGDGAIEEGVVHEALNFASKMEIPVLFVCENNFFSSHLHIKERQPSIFNSRFAHAHQIKTSLVDGNNIKQIQESAGNLIEFIRETGKPAFIEAFTYRLFGHVDWREDIDVGVGRSIEDLKKWKNRDPILRLEKAFGENEMILLQLISMKKEVMEEIKVAWSKAEKDENPPADELLAYVYQSNGFNL
jgi:pyruvate dehydrogenase E1 component alpha subunit